MRLYRPPQSLHEYQPGNSPPSSRSSTSDLLSDDIELITRGIRIPRLSCKPACTWSKGHSILLAAT